VVCAVRLLIGPFFVVGPEGGKGSLCEEADGFDDDSEAVLLIFRVNLVYHLVSVSKRQFRHANDYYQGVDILEDHEEASNVELREVQIFNLVE
jgi:hypothetical protein